jgi:hypothetical protein
MSSLQTKIEENFQLCLKFLGLNDLALKNGNLSVTIEHVENVSPSLRVYLQQICFKQKVKQKLSLKANPQKVKIEQVEEQKLGSEVILQKVKVEQVEEQKLGLKIDLQ